MAWDPTVPNQSNQLRGATGDIAKVRENFEALDPLMISGIHALVSGGTAASGVVAVLQGTGPTSQWHYTTLPSVITTLGGLTDVSAAAPSLNDVLKWNGSLWAPAADASGGGGGGGGGVERLCQIRLPSGVNQGVGAIETVTGMELNRNVGGFAIDTAGGVIEVPSGVTHVRIAGQLRFSGGDPGQRQVILEKSTGESFLLGHGSYTFNVPSGSVPLVIEVQTPLLSIAGHGVADAVEGVDGTDTNLVPGDGIVIRGAALNGGGDVDVQWGFEDADDGNLGKFQTYLQVEAFKLVSAETSSAAVDAMITMVMTSGGTYAVPNTGAHIVSGVSVTQKATGGLTGNSGTITIPTGSGYTHAQAMAQISWAGDAAPTGYRQGGLTQNGGGVITDEVGDLFISLASRQPAVGGASSASFTQFLSPLIPISGGQTTFELIASQTDTSGDQDVTGGAVQEGTLTFFQIRCFKLA